MKLTTAEQMKELDRQAIEELGIPSIDLMERAAACGALEMVTSFAENLEFTAVGVNKGTAVQALSARLGLGPEQVMAFGDAGNDLELLSWAGWSFAMANATDQAKAAARYVTGSNTEAGVAMAVERYFLDT